jgi:hypothetical protein
MAITSANELAQAVSEAGRLLQEIQDYKGRDLDKACRVRFPRGWIRSAAHQRARVAFISDSVLKDNVAYTLILADVLHWHLSRTDITGTAKEMLIKCHMFLLGTVIESVTKICLKGRCGHSFGKRNEFMLAHQIIGASLKAELDWLWDMRNRMHLFMIERSEYNLSDYTIETHNRSVRAFRELLDSLVLADKPKGNKSRGSTVSH